MAIIEKRKNSYIIRVSCGYDINGQQIRRNMTWKPDNDLTPRQLEKELQRQAVLFEEKCKNGLFLDGSIKFADFADKWIKEYAEKQLKAKTIARYKEFLIRINKAMGHIRLDKIQPQHLLQFYDNLSEEGVRNDIKYKCKANINPLISETKAAFCRRADLSMQALNNACKGLNVSESTAQKISAALNLKLSELFIANSEKTLSNKTILEHHRLISSILSTAVEWQAIPYNPCQRVKPPKVIHKESRYLDEKEAIHLFECLQNEPLKYQTIITTLIYTGFRRGELCGLKWADIDFDKSLISINREILYLPEKGLYEDTTKNATSNRIIKVSNLVMSILKEYKKEQNVDRIKCGDQWQNNDYVFTQWNGAPMHPDSISSWFKNFIIENNLPDVSLHSLRHTNATLMIANGINITTVSKRLGHANTATTTKIYAHAIRSADEAAADTLQDILNPKYNKPQTNHF